MQEPTKRWLMRTLALGLVIGLARLAWLVTAPSVADTCEHVLALAEASGEPIGEAERTHCLVVVEGRRDAAGLAGWAKLSRCIADTRSLDEAGRCKAR